MGLYACIRSFALDSKGARYNGLKMDKGAQGVLEDTDPDIRDLVKYKRLRIVAEEDAPAVTAQAGLGIKVELEDLTQAALIACADPYKIKGMHQMNKSDLVAAIKLARTAEAKAAAAAAAAPPSDRPGGVDPFAPALELD